MSVDLSSGLLMQLRAAETAAFQHAERGEFAEAGKQFRRCYRLMQQYADQPGAGQTVRAIRLDKAETYLTRALQAEAQAKANTSALPNALAEKTAGDNYQLAAEALITQVNVGWEDIGGLDATKEAIQLTYALGLVRLPAGVRLQTSRRLLFYGPPGTGKTLLAAAISHELDATFFNARIPDLMSQYFGESSKLLSGLYAAAEVHAPAVVFLDEIDALSRRRGGGQESGAERRLLNTFLGELDGLQAKRDETPFILTVAATNVPWDLDAAVVSRFSGGLICVPLPDEAARRAILSLYIDRRGYTSAVPVGELAAWSDGYSGRELEQVVAGAIRAMVRRANPDLLAVTAGGQDALRAYELRTESLTRADFELGFTQVQRATSPAQADRYVQWARQVA